MDKISPDLMEVILQRERAHADALARNDQIALSYAPIEVRVALQSPAESLMSPEFGIPVYCTGLLAGTVRGAIHGVTVDAEIT